MKRRRAAPQRLVLFYFRCAQCLSKIVSTGQTFADIQTQQSPFPPFFGRKSGKGPESCCRASATSHQALRLLRGVRTFTIL